MIAGRTLRGRVVICGASVYRRPPSHFWVAAVGVVFSLSMPGRVLVLPFLEPGDSLAQRLLYVVGLCVFGAFLVLGPTRQRSPGRRETARAPRLARARGAARRPGGSVQ